MGLYGIGWAHLEGRGIEGGGGSLTREWGVLGRMDAEDGDRGGATAWNEAGRLRNQVGASCRGR